MLLEGCSLLQNLKQGSTLTFLWPFWTLILIPSQLPCQHNSHTSLMLTFLWPFKLGQGQYWHLWPFKLGHDHTLRNVWILSKLYRDILHVNISDDFDVDLGVTFQTRPSSALPSTSKSDGVCLFDQYQIKLIIWSTRRFCTRAATMHLG